MPQIQGTVVTALPGVPAGQTTTTFSQGRQGDLLASEIHGKFYTAAKAGNVFLAATAAAGVTIPISSATAPTFTLYNPAGSGIVAELISLDVGLTVVTSVASPLLLGFTSGITAATAPSSVTARAVQNALLGGAPGICQFYTAATITAVTTFYTFGQVTATNATAGNSVGPFFHTDFDGKLILTPGSFVHVCGTAAQTSPTTITLAYSEWPI